MWKFKSWNNRDKWLFLLTMGVALCILAFPVGSVGKKSASAAAFSLDGGKTVGEQMTNSGGGAQENEAVEVSAQGNRSYEEQLEKRVKELLKDVEGVGTVDVMIVLKSTSEKVIHTAGNSAHSVSEEQGSDGILRKSEESQQEESAVVLDSDGIDTPIIEKELYPEISGIVISASGGGSPTVRSEISAAMEALFGLPAHKIKVLKRVQ